MAPAASRSRARAAVLLVVSALQLAAGAFAAPSADTCEASEVAASQLAGAAVDTSDAAAILEQANAQAARGEFAAALPSYSESRRLAVTCLPVRRTT